MAAKRAKTCTRCGNPTAKGYYLNSQWYCDPCFELVLPQWQQRLTIPDDEPDHTHDDDRLTTECDYHGEV